MRKFFVATTWVAASAGGEYKDKYPNHPVAHHKKNWDSFQSRYYFAPFNTEGPLHIWAVSGAGNNLAEVEKKTGEKVSIEEWYFDDSASVLKKVESGTTVDAEKRVKIAVYPHHVGLDMNQLRDPKTFEPIKGLKAVLRGVDKPEETYPTGDLERFLYWNVYETYLPFSKETWPFVKKALQGAADNLGPGAADNLGPEASGTGFCDKWGCLIGIFIVGCLAVILGVALFLATRKTDADEADSSSDI